VASQHGQDLTHDDVLEITHVTDFTQRFSDYKTIIGVSDAGGRDDPDALKGSQYAFDSRVARWRPVVVEPEVDYSTQQGSSSEYGKASGGSIADTYAIGELINLNLPKWGKKGQMVIAAVDYDLSGTSHRKVRLTLKPLDTYTPVPVSNVFYNWIDRPSNIDKIIGPLPQTKPTATQNEDKYYADTQAPWGNVGDGSEIFDDLGSTISGAVRGAGEIIFDGASIEETWPLTEKKRNEAGRR